MKEKKCSVCTYAEVLSRKRVVRCGDMVLYQCKGTIVCKCPDVTSITINDNGMICSSFRVKGAESDDA